MICRLIEEEKGCPFFPRYTGGETKGGLDTVPLQ